VVQGRLKCSTAGEEGKELVLRIMDPGEVLGDIALLDGNPRSATVTALEAAELLVIQRRDLLPFLRTHPNVAIKLLEAAAERVRRLSNLLEDTQFLNLPSRLARKLLALSDAYGVEADGGTQIELRLSQQDLGEMVGTTRESINKQLRTWADEGVLTHENRVLTIRNEAVLEDLAQYSIL
jgi:CRP-like cAMP-binding protein